MRRDWVAVGGLSLLALALRVVGLDAKGYWEDEAATVALLREPLGDMLSAVADSERAPPLYYLLAWPWTRVFGEGEVALRSLSVVLGTAAVPLAYLAARELVSRRAGLVAAALVAANPLLIWYSQEARTYALVVMLSAAALFFFARALRDPSPSALGLWALCSALALSAHYFAGFLFVGEAVWLLARLGATRRVLLAVAGPTVVGAALVPLAVAQQSGRHGHFWIPDVSLASRVGELPGFLLVGFELPVPLAFALAAVAAALAAVGVWLLATRGDPRERGGAIVAASVAAVGLALPLALVPLGVDTFLYRNVIAVTVPLAIVVAAGLGAARARALGAAAAVCLVALSVGIALAVASEPKYQREAWREAAEALGDPDGDRAIVVTPGPSGREPLELVYLREAKPLESASAHVDEIDLVALPRRDSGEIANATLPELDGPPPPPAPGFELVEAVEEKYLLLFRYRAPSLRRVGFERLEQAALDGGTTPLVLVERR